MLVGWSFFKIVMSKNGFRKRFIRNVKEVRLELSLLKIVKNY
jgi:hypothetical protein